MEPLLIFVLVAGFILGRLEGRWESEYRRGRGEMAEAWARRVRYRKVPLIGGICRKR